VFSWVVDMQKYIGISLANNFWDIDIQSVKPLGIVVVQILQALVLKFDLTESLQFSLRHLVLLRIVPCSISLMAAKFRL
jgi:hypothetical protein